MSGEQTGTGGKATEDERDRWTGYKGWAGQVTEEQTDRRVTEMEDGDSS